jgi:hypothetical protein
MNALLFASVCGHTSTVQVLVDAGADKEAKDEVRKQIMRRLHIRMSLEGMLK